jgi:hypothetical protein
MSAPADRSRWHQEPDRLPLSPSLVLMGVFVAVVLASIAASWVLLAPWRAGHPSATHIHGTALQSTLPVGPATIAGVHQAPIDPAAAAARVERQRSRLAGYGWTDDGHAVAHIPIEDAMDLVVAGVEPARPAGKERAR